MSAVDPWSLWAVLIVRAAFFLQGSLVRIVGCVGHATLSTEQQNLIEDNSTLLKSSHTIWTPTEGLRLMASCAFGRHPRPDFEPKVQTGEPTGTATDDHERQWRGRCCHKRRLENRLMVRRRDP